MTEREFCDDPGSDLDEQEENSNKQGGPADGTDSQELKRWAEWIEETEKEQRRRS